MCLQSCIWACCLSTSCSIELPVGRFKPAEGLMLACQLQTTSKGSAPYCRNELARIVLSTKLPPGIDKYTRHRGLACLITPCG
ncbi:hypothetical protein EVAR_101355_1, partial [Eumeta japonica]